MRVILEPMVGDRATQILFQAIRSARNAHDLVSRISQQLVNEPLREQALASITQLLTEASRTLSGEIAPAPAVGSPRPETISVSRKTLILKDEESSQLLSNELAKYIGPIAKMLLKKRLAKATSIQDLVSQLEQEIPVPSDQIAFRKAVQKMKLLPA